MHGHADHESCGLSCPVGGADGTTHQTTIDGITLDESVMALLERAVVEWPQPVWQSENGKSVDPT